ncbi:hypothetical protein GOB94_02625 [Granulicella sp. 5B5]|uniref:hypothetical protein n=1 Tax=Granulicella sp. 5B5 TaxID=1617967 RepID=UPI0015F3B0E4|nr:hypothetical protein [Granulicella sp. 5B5]QMV17715.1 hypothetical protein GOB94_02625 [Granulicella sp. 5B5]
MLLWVGGVLLFLSVFPVMAVVSLGQWETAFVASKLLMLPVGAICLLGAAGLQVSHGRQ